MDLQCPIKAVTIHQSINFVTVYLLMPKLCHCFTLSHFVSFDFVCMVLLSRIDFLALPLLERAGARGRALDKQEV